MSPGRHSQPSLFLSDLHNPPQLTADEQIRHARSSGQVFQVSARSVYDRLSAVSRSAANNSLVNLILPSSHLVRVEGDQRDACAAFWSRERESDSQSLLPSPLSLSSSSTCFDAADVVYSTAGSERICNTSINAVKRWLTPTHVDQRHQ